MLAVTKGGNVRQSRRGMMFNSHERKEYGKILLTSRNSRKSPTGRIPRRESSSAASRRFGILSRGKRARSFRLRRADIIFMCLMHVRGVRLFSYLISCCFLSGWGKSDNRSDCHFKPTAPLSSGS